MTAFDRAVKRVEYRLTYDRTEARGFGRFEVEGPWIPDAYKPGAMAPGDWCHEDYPDDDAPVPVWLAHFAAMCVAEAVHEALEWYRVDGKPWLDAHGTHEQAIHDAVTELSDRLAKLAETP